MSNLSDLDKSIKELESQALILKDNNKVLAKIAEIKLDLENTVELVKQNNEGFSELVIHIKSKLEELTNQTTSLQKKNEKLIDDLTSTNKKLIRELEDALVSKLDRLSSDIQNALRIEVQQLEKSVKNDLTEKFIHLSESFKGQLKEHELKNKEFIENQNKNIKMFIYVVIGLIIVNIALSLIN